MSHVSQAPEIIQRKGYGKVEILKSQLNGHFQ